MFELMPFEHRNHFGVYDPFRDLEKFEKSFFGDFASAFKTDIQDNGDSYLLEADLPGVEKGDIKIDIEGDCLTVTAQRSGQVEEKDEKNRYVRRERSYGSYSRSFDISGIKADEISAAYENGVLKLTLPKKGEATPTSRRLEIQ